jgi:putative Holliday junction resolvase
VKVLAVDHGSARCGLAVSDPSGTIVRPVDPVDPTDPAELARRIEDEAPELVLVGLPVSLDGEEGEQAGVVRKFVASLEPLIVPPVRLWDERLTTAMASASRRGGARAAEDSLAAAHLLESYLDSAEARA